MNRRELSRQYTALLESDQSRTPDFPCPSRGGSNRSR